LHHRLRRPIHFDKGPNEDAIVTDNPSDADVPGSSGARRKTRPPVIELEATDVTPPDYAKSGAAETAANANHETETRPGDMNASSGGKHLIGLLVLTGTIGVLAGALAIALTFLFFGEGITRLSSKSTEGTFHPVTATSALNERLEQLAKIISEYEKRIVTIENRALDLTPLTNRAEKVETTVSDLRRLSEQMQTSTLATAEALVDRIIALESRLKQSPPPAVANAAEIVALGALQDAIIKGTPFRKELAAARAILGDRAAPLASLESAAESGLPTIAVLNARFAALASKLLREPEPESGYFARLLAHAGRLVEVRPIGNAEGTSVGAVVARMETWLARGDLSAALEEASHMPANIRSDAGDWIGTATFRRDAEAMVKNLLNTALAGTARETQQQ
jgi:hypothetical protein